MLSSVNTCALPSSCSQFSLPLSSRCLFISASFRRQTRTRPRTRTRRRRNKLSSPSAPTFTTTTITTSTSFISSEPKLETVIDINKLTSQASSTFRSLFPSTLRKFVSSAADAYTDLQTLVTLDHDRRLVVSCRPSTLHFLGTSALFSFVAFSILRFLVNSVSRFLSWRRNASAYRPMVRRDRSLGGKEVVVGWGESAVSKGPANPLSPADGGTLKRGAKKNKIRLERKLPKWWPAVINGAVFDLDEQDEFKRQAYRVVRAITDSRMAGNDIMEDDIIQLRQLCRTSGVQVSFETTNIRDSLYRASVNYVLNVCSRVPTYSTSIDINGEDARQFLAGFAENIGLENIRAATIVSAAVAARTRSCLLQAWALEMQGKHVESMAELSKICHLLQIFPPEESSPEMEMVGRGLTKHLKLEQRKHLMFLFGKVSGDNNHRIAREALGLMHSQNLQSDQVDNMA
ncbi:hypothetical protein HN51_056425 [Arachis hypogaea]|uniref:Uncharacterized protein n=1 Tax=Arachis hypogaea TaxID=3818 RepID=A0A444XTT6_ARAHY|nr:uncharacterized protein LOC107617303 [Arachis ipaensis]XP_025674631.1 uncharacterized protein LOC112775295 isoform X1 [Arachis hypogaea]QHN79273.1 uncharacterized protein DS421_19g668710 [Arachis hypogaea]RYQ93188.1 hypothetical protein Ahy_B09g099467 [Arachis hypogaea]